MTKLGVPVYNEELEEEEAEEQDVEKENDEVLVRLTSVDAIDGAAGGIGMGRLSWKSSLSV